MHGKENLYFALGEMAYAIAATDGHITEDEKRALHKIVMEELNKDGDGIDFSEIVFSVLNKDHMNLEDAVHWGIREMKLYSHYLSPEIKGQFIAVIWKVAEAHPPISRKAKELIRKFTEEITKLEGDPVFYEK